MLVPQPVQYGFSFDIERVSSQPFTPFSAATLVNTDRLVAPPPTLSKRKGRVKGSRNYCLDTAHLIHIVKGALPLEQNK